MLIQFSTLLILAVAANTSFADFPRLSAILARDGFLPRQFTGLGDRLVFTNGIIFLAIAAGVLIVIFGGNSHLLIHSLCNWSLPGVHAFAVWYGRPLDP